MVAAVITFSILNKRGYSKAIVIICCITAIWFETVLSVSSFSGWVEAEDTKFHTHDKLNVIDFPTMIFLNYIGTPVFTLIFIAYVYWDELCDKVGFLMLDKRIKEYKKLRTGVQKLVPKIVLKFQLKKDNHVEISNELVFISVKISNYTALVC